MRIDCQTHIFPVEYAEVLAQNSEWPQTVLEADQFVLTYNDAQTFVMGREAQRRQAQAVRHGRGRH